MTNNKKEFVGIEGNIICDKYNDKSFGLYLRHKDNLVWGNEQPYPYWCYEINVSKGISTKIGFNEFENKNIHTCMITMETISLNKFIQCCRRLFNKETNIQIEKELFKRL